MTVGLDIDDDSGIGFVDRDCSIGIETLAALGSIVNLNRSSMNKDVAASLHTVTVCGDKGDGCLQCLGILVHILLHPLGESVDLVLPQTTDGVEVTVITVNCPEAQEMFSKVISIHHDTTFL